MKKLVLKVLPTIFLVVFGFSVSFAQNEMEAVKIEASKKTDNVTVLMAASAKMSEGLNVKNPDKPPKHFWVEEMDDTGAYLEWKVFAEKTSAYHVTTLLRSEQGEQFEVSVLNSNSVLKITSGISGWDKIDVGTIELEQGENTIRFTKKSALATASVKSLELIEQKGYKKYLKRVKNFKTNTDWLASSGYGLMFQFGAWGYPEKGEQRKSAEELASTFNMDAFVEMVKETGASYVIWSLTWWDYKMMMPVESVDQIIGNGDRTTSVNFIEKLAITLKQNDIRFMLYYHLGHASHMGGETDWWQAQKWPVEFAATGTGNREVFFENWMTVVGEIGVKLGKNLDGWWFDDGLVYYPAPFEQMGAIARKGNSKRLIGYNSWICPRYTDFQDVYFGENSHGEQKAGSSPEGGNGVFESGPQKGLLQHAMFIMEGDWGIHNPNQKIVTRVKEDDLKRWVESASKRHVPLSINLLMWEDGRVSQESLNMIKELKNLK